jgi:hypothetical protein
MVKGSEVRRQEHGDGRQALTPAPAPGLLISSDGAAAGVPTTHNSDERHAEGRSMKRNINEELPGNHPRQHDYDTNQYGSASSSSNIDDTKRIRLQINTNDKQQQQQSSSAATSGSPIVSERIDGKTISISDASSHVSNKTNSSNNIHDVKGNTINTTSTTAITTSSIVNNNLPATPSSSALKATTTTMPSLTDIYGRIPGKEPKHTIPCPNDCGRQLSSSRLALHLEKCLGLVTSSRRGSGGAGKLSSAVAAAAAAASARSATPITTTTAKVRGGDKKVAKPGKQTRRRSSKVT